MEADNSSSGMYRPCVEPAAQSQRFDDVTTVSSLGLESSAKCTSVQNMDDSQLVGVPVAVAGDSTPVTANVIGSEKRKRGRPPRSQAAKPPPPKRPREAEEEEDVCFICFDGGSLVLCDRKGCPKAYHPACIKRDEAFFRSKAKWNCGWHICSVCQKASHYLCYTCTYSLCKACTKSADYLCVRGNKGFCSTCMRTIMLIENKDQGNKEMVQVDFDDKSSWEYLFKVYWVLLKEKLSLTLSELIQAKNPWKESDAVHGKRKQLRYGHCVANDGKGLLDKSFDSLGLKKPKELLELPYKNPPSTGNRTIAECNNNTVPSSSPESELTKLEFQSKGCLNTEQASTIIGKSVNGCTGWASKELLDFVAHMKDGDTSALSQFDVQALLLDYIKRYNLRDPRQKSQIICDLRLKSLFGKPRVGHIEMLKLLEYHILTMEEPKKSAFIPAGIVGTVTSHVDPYAKNDISSLTNNNKKRKTRRNGEVKLTPINLDEYAAIDAHNINIIYLRRDLMENLAEDVEKFHDKVVGSVVRIRIPGNDQKQEIYRLVHVVGTCKSSVPYKIGNKSVDVLLEVVNLDKKEALSIDSISNQDFSEDECRRLRQSIKCGLAKRLTIGEIQKKAMELRAVKLNDSLEAEKLRLNHLRDRASENGRKKELRECVEKLELLQTPEERQRRLLESPEVHADPKMDPNYESEGDGGEYVDKRKVEYSGPRCTRISTRKEKLVYSGSQVKEEGPITAQCKASEKREAHGTNILEKLGNQLIVDQVVDRSGSENSLASLSMPNSSSTNNSETDQVWHYRDPSGRMQGPFSIMQLRKWNTSGLFPPDMRIWTNHEHEDSVLLINGLKGLFHKSPDNRNSFGWSESVTGTVGECGESEVPRHLHNASNHSNGNIEFTRADRLSPSLPQCLDLLKGNSSCCDKQQLSTPVPSSRQREVIIALPHQERSHANVNFHCALGLVTPDSRGSIMCQTTDGNDHDMQSKSQSYLGASSAQNRGSFTSNRSSINLDSGPSFASVTKSSYTFEQKEKMNHLPDLPSPTPETSYSDLETQAAEKLLSLSSDVHLRASDIQELPSPTPISKGEAQGGQTAAHKASVPSSLPVQESGPSWSSPPTLVIFGAQFREIADDWGKYSPAAKPSTEEWDSGLVSGSSLKPAEAVADHVARHTSNADQLNHTSPSHPVLNLSSWQAGSGPIEFSTLAEESVSDLLAEVDAMEYQTQNGMGSPTSAMRCGEEMIPGCKNDCFSSIEELSPTPDPAKSDALSSSGEIQLHCQSTVADEPVRASQADAFDPLKRSGGNSSTSSEGETKSANVQFTQGVAGSNIPTPCTTSQNTAFSAMGQNMGLEGMASARGAAPGNMTWGGPVQGFANIAMDGSMGATWGNSHMNRGPPFPGNPVWDSQRRSGGERPGGPRDWTLQGGDSGRGRSSGNRQQPYGNRQQPYGGSGGYSRPPPKGHRICKFYESGRCKKGASCDYLHP